MELEQNCQLGGGPEMVV